jgi:tetratricopeptide (TPR) repeat protein
MTSRRVPSLALTLVAITLCLQGCAGAPVLPQNAVQLNNAGARALQQGDLESAGAQLELALEYSPQFVEALSNLGLVELQRGNFARAEQLLRRALRLNADLPHPYHGMGVLEEQRYNIGDAAHYFRQALEVDPGFAPARAALAKLLLHGGSNAQALVQFRRLSLVAPDDPAGSVGLASVLLSLGRLEEARKVLRSARERFGQRADLRVVEGRRLILVGQLEAAKEYLAPLAGHRDAEGVAALAWMAVAELAEGRHRHAVGAADRALTLDPEHPLASYVMAMALDALQDPSAESWVQRAMMLNPNHPQLRQRLLASERPAAGQRATDP